MFKHRQQGNAWRGTGRRANKNGWAERGGMVDGKDRDVGMSCERWKEVWISF